MSTITTLPSAINASKSVIDTNFSNLNTDKLESTDLKTVNGNSLVGSGDIVISGGGSVATDTIWDAKGDLAGGTGANTASRLAVGSNGQVLTADSAEATGLKWTNPAGGGDALTSGTLAQFASTTSAQLATVISDETGSGSLVFATSPTLVTPSLGVATATSINGATITSGTLNGSVTGTNTGNQTITNTSDATSHTATLSATGGSIKLVEGSGITLTTTGTGADGIVTIASTGGGGSGDVVGPASATDNAIARFDATTGKLIQNSVVTISDTGSIVSTGTFHNFSTAQVFVDTLEVQSSDTTISRVSAGVIAVEGDTIITRTTNTRYFDIYAIEKATDNAVGTNIIGAIECPFTGTITEIGAYVETAGVTGASVWDVNKNGTTIMTTNKLSIDSAEVSTRTAATAPTLTTTAITAGDLITIDTDSLSTTKPKGLHVRIGIRQS